MKFQLNDWVQITPTPDTRWHVWYNEREVYDHFCGRIGQIIKVYDHSPQEPKYDVIVHFPKGFDNHPPGNYFQLFKADHLVPSSAYNAKIHYNLEKAGDEIQSWENFVKNKRDEIFRHICSKDEPNIVPQNTNSYKPTPIDILDSPYELPDDENADPDQWDAKTVPNMPNPMIKNSSTSNTSTAGNSDDDSTSTYTDPYDISYYSTD